MIEIDHIKGKGKLPNHLLLRDDHVSMFYLFVAPKLELHLDQNHQGQGMSNQRIHLEQLMKVSITIYLYKPYDYE